MEIFILLGLILLNGFFSMAEIALVSARKARLESQSNKGVIRAKVALALALQRKNLFGPPLQCNLVAPQEDV